MKIQIFQDTLDLFRKKISLKQYIRCISRFFFGKKLDYYGCKYDEIISLGYNCEISQRFSDVFCNSKFEHYLYTWSYEYDREGFLSSLKNLDNFVETTYSVLPNGMIKHEKYNIAFHAKYPKEELISEYNLTTKIIPEAIEELKDRLNYLSKKTERIFHSDRKCLFVLKLKRTQVEQDINFVTELNNILKNKFDNPKAEYTLLVVIEKADYSKDELRYIYNQSNLNVKYSAINCFANDADTGTDGDILGWNRILKEFLI